MVDIKRVTALLIRQPSMNFNSVRSEKIYKVQFNFKML